MPARSALALLLASTLSLALTGCSDADARCDPNPVGEAWKPYESLLPDKAVVCGPNRKSAAKPSEAVDDYPPTQVFVFYEDTNAAAAFDATLKKLEAAGWKVTQRNVYGEGRMAQFDGEVQKDGVTIRIGVNRNDWGTQGSLELELPKT